jgi:protein-tyrosine kinase
MEQIRQAIERAKAAASVQPSAANATTTAAVADPLPRPTGAPIANSIPRPTSGPKTGIRGIELQRSHIEGRRIVSHHAGDPRSKAFDMLRTQTLQSMDQGHWQFAGITSPTAGCGKTLTAVNLAFSIARQSERSVFLLDLDLHKPQVAPTLGLQTKFGVVSVLEGRAKLTDAVVEAQVGNVRMLVLPAETRVIDTTELITSRAMGRMLQEIKHEFPGHTVLIDLPPLLSSDDVIALLPQIDCVLLVAAVGTSTVSEIKECNKHLQSSNILRIVLNKSAEPAAAYYASAA